MLGKFALHPKTESRSCRTHVVRFFFKMCSDLVNVETRSCSHDFFTEIIQKYHMIKTDLVTLMGCVLLE